MFFSADAPVDRQSNHDRGTETRRCCGDEGAADLTTATAAFVDFMEVSGSASLLKSSAEPAGDAMYLILEANCGCE